MKDNGGLITADDLASYRARLRPPTHIRYREFDVYGIGPPSSGGITLGIMLQILERFDLKASGRDSSPRTLHLVTEAMRRAYFVRATQLADPDFVPVPVDKLLSRRIRRRTGRLHHQPGHPQPAACRLPHRRPPSRRQQHHPPLHHRRPGKRRRPHLHPRRRLRLQGRCPRRGLPSQ